MDGIVSVVSCFELDNDDILDIEHADFVSCFRVCQHWGLIQTWKVTTNNHNKQTNKMTTAEKNGSWAMHEVYYILHFR